MSPTNKRKLFYTIYFTLVLLPAIAMLLSGYLRGGENLIRDLAVFLGFIGMSLAGIQLISIGRIHWLADALDLDKVYNNHHWVSLLSVLLIIAHFMLLSFYNPIIAGFLNIFKAPWMIAAGSIGLFGLLLIGITSVLRKSFKMDYRYWLFIHDILTIIILTFGMIHLFKVGYYTSHPFMKAIWIFEIAVWVVAFAYIRIIRPIRIGQKPYMVESVVGESADTYTLTLVPDGHDGVSFEAGQVAWISTGPSPFNLHRNPFSYSGSSEAPGGAIRFSIKNLGDFTSTVPHMQKGQRVYVDGPYGTFNLEDPRMQKGLVLIAGGIGLAPVMSILNTLADRGDKRPAYVFYGDFNEDTALYADEFEQLKPKLNMAFVQVLEKPLQDDYPHQGYITKDVMLAHLPQNYNELFYFVCGPAAMLRAVEKHFDAMGISDSQIHEENYTMA
jgi:predicted ferric reductase